MTDRRGTNGMIAVLNELYAENRTLQARIEQLEAAALERLLEEGREIIAAAGE